MTERPSSEAVAAAATAALQRSRSPVVSVSEEHDYEKRQNFRRLIDPGIFRPNSRDQTLSFTETIRSFNNLRPTNDLIKHQLMEPKGTLEYAIALGFRAEVKDFQPYYVFNPRHVADLRIGAAILAEAIDLEEKKQERLKRSRAEEKAAAAAAAQNAHDRKTRALRDSRERETRNASEPHQVPSDIISHTDASPLPEVVMPGVGYSLASPDPDVDQHE
ncbi:hypothetical protein EDD17DRAFT_1884828 [Pisolithus thermaeus]|nr:hypothetical protein EDD17DRAFT_1884828 [Pisolithus thermaeus]